jgi:orotidine-5'-phosphate decarboxylase
VTDLGFGERLGSVFSAYGHLCVGIDPHPFLMKEWGFNDDSAGLREFSLRVVDACVGRVGIIKPQVAFFERHGSRGYEVLELLLERARNSGLIVIADAKRGDIGSTMEAYASTWLTPGSALEADALTVSPFLGVASLAPTVNLALAANKGIFMLAATSNPEAAGLQQSVTIDGPHRGQSVAQSILSHAEQWSVTRDPAGSIGVVLGATLDLEQFSINPDDYPSVPVLAPGFGFQGARVEDARSVFGSMAKNLIVSETRSVLAVGRGGVVESITRRANEVADALS